MAKSNSTKAHPKPHIGTCNLVPIRLHRRVHRRLERMMAIETLLNKLPNGEDEALCAEYRQLLPSAVEVFLPLIQHLVAAGLLNVSIDVKDPAFGPIDRFETIDGEVTQAVDGGAIWLHAMWSGGALKSG